MPERTSDGNWKWGNIKKKSRKELAQTVYGIWKGSGSKGSFHNFYHYGNGYRTSKKNKLKKETYLLNPLFVVSESIQFNRLVTSRKPYTLKDIDEYIDFVKKSKENPHFSKRYLNLLDKLYQRLQVLRVKMTRGIIKEIPAEVMDKIIPKR